VNKAERFADVKSAILDFLTAMDEEAYVLGDDAFAALLDAALIRRGKMAVQPQSVPPNVAISAVR
jgi:hypothetical protein